MDLSVFKDMLQNDTITAGYGVVSSTLRKAAGKLLGNKGVGQTGMNAISLAAGMGLSQVKNPHVQIIGSALRISGIAGVGNAVIDRVVSKVTKSEDKA